MGRLHFGINRGIFLAITAFSVISAACSKETKGPLSSSPKGLTGNGAAATAADAAPVGGDVTRVRTEMREADEFLKKSIEAEAAARLEADKNLADKIVALETKLDALNTFLKNEVARLDAKDKEIAGKLAEEIAAREAGDAANAKALSDARAALEAANDATRAESARAVAEAERKIQEVSQNLATFQAYANANFATKTELDVVRGAVDQLNAVTDILNKKIDANDAAINSRLTSELTAAKDQLRSEIAAVQADVDSVRNALNAHIQTFKATVQKLTDEATAAALQAQEMISSVRRDSADAQQKIRASIENLANKTAALEVYSLETRNALTQKFTELKNADAQLSKEVNDARAAAEKELLAAIAVEQQNRTNLEAKVSNIAVSLEKVSAIASEGLALAKKNSQKIAELKTELASESASLALRITGVETKFDTQIAALRQDMSNKIDEVRKHAETMVKDLGVDVSKQFAALSAALGEIQNRDEAAEKDIVRALSNHIRNEAKLSAFDAAQKAPQLLVVNRTKDLNLAIAELERRFVDAIDPIGKKAGVNIVALDTSFMDTLNAIGVRPEAINVPFTVSQGKEFFLHLAREYVRILMRGELTNNPEVDRIFVGQRIALDGNSLGSSLAQGLLVPYASTAEKQGSVAAVEGWARSNLLSVTPMAKTIRDALLRSPDFQRAVVALKDAMDPNLAAAKAYEDLVRLHLRNYGMSDGNIELLLKEGLPPAVALRPVLATIILERAQSIAQLAEETANKNRFLELAREVAAQKDRVNQNTAAISALNAKSLELDNKIAQVARATQDAVNRLESSQRVAFNLIAAIAGRLGYDDLVKKAAEESARIGGAIDPALQVVPASCMAVQHFYNHATRKDIPVGRCESYLSRPNQTVTYAQLTRCAVHGAWNWGGGYAGYTWGNPWMVDNGWQSQNWAIDDGHVSNNGLALYLDHSGAISQEAKSIGKRPASSAYPVDGKSVFMLRVFGSASKFRITSKPVSGQVNTYGTAADPTQQPITVTVDAPEYLMSGAGTNLVYEIPLPFAVGTLGSCRWDRQIDVVPIKSDGTQGTTTCSHRFHTFSPLVLDFANQGMVKTLNPQLSKTRFDLDADGTVDATGWTDDPQSAMLAMDLNGNGKIDDGSELFGEATRLANGERASDGFAALARYDSHGKGFVDARDPAFQKLLLWFDVNQDGVSQSYELKTLASMGVTRISTRFVDVPKDDVIQNHGMEEANVVRYQATFFGPEACGKQGCKVYDVYFGSSQTKRFVSWME